MSLNYIDNQTDKKLACISNKNLKSQKSLKSPKRLKNKKKKIGKRVESNKKAVLWPQK